MKKAGTQESGQPSYDSAPYIFIKAGIGSEKFLGKDHLWRFIDYHSFLKQIQNRSRGVEIA